MLKSGPSESVVNLPILDVSHNQPRLRGALHKRYSFNDLRLQFYGDREQHLPACGGLKNAPKMMACPTKFFWIGEHYAARFCLVATCL